MKKSFIDCDRAVVANDQSAEVAEPGEGAFYLPAASVTAQRSAVLRARLASIPAMRGDQFDASRRQSLAQRIAVIGAIPRHDLVGLRGSKRASLPRAGLRPERQSKAAFPEEHPGRRPPPSTSCPCPAWFFRLSSPFFCRSETAVQERLAPVQLLALVQFRQKCAPNGEPDPLLFPVSKPSPARGGRREFVRQILPASAAAQNPQNPFENFAILGSRPATVPGIARFRQQRSDLLPLGVGQQTTVSRHEASLGAAAPTYLAFSAI